MATTPAQTSSGAVNGVLQFEESDHDGALKVCRFVDQSLLVCESHYPWLSDL